MVWRKDIIKPKHYCNKCRYYKKAYEENGELPYPCRDCDPNTHNEWQPATEWKE